MKKVVFILFALFAIVIGLYPVLYTVIPEGQGFLSTKGDLLQSNLWYGAFLGHIIFGGIALLTGWSQFSTKWRNKRLVLHRRLGKIYMTAVYISGGSAIYMSFHANGGWISGLGFFLLGVIWISTTFKALSSIKKRNIDAHQYWMIYSYAACFAAVTLRIEMPLLIAITKNPELAYLLVAWLCWVPNMVIAWRLTKH